MPYRDSKLTRILQESLGGNSRTTLVINCSPSAYNEAETLSTLRFGMRAKSIKNKARVNAELSPAELKALLKKAQSDLAKQGGYVVLLEQELTVWRKGGQVDEKDWATMEKALGVKLELGEAGNVGLGGPLGLSSPRTGGAAGRETPGTPSGGGSRPFTPSHPALDGLRSEGASRPETPTLGAMDKDEREEFLRRENELSDQLADKEEALAKSERHLAEVQEELGFFKEQEATMSKVGRADISFRAKTVADVLGRDGRTTRRWGPKSTSSACKSRSSRTRTRRPPSWPTRPGNRTRTWRPSWTSSRRAWPSSGRRPGR